MSNARNLIRALLPFLLLALAASGCRSGDTDPVDGGDERDASFLGTSGKADAFGVAEKTPAALGILRLVNDVDLETLTDTIGLSARTARSLVEARSGDDEVLGTYDDHEIVSLAELDDVPYVGPVSFGRLVEHATSEGYVVPWALRVEAPGSVVAVGDLHGDLEATRSALQIAGAIDENDHWIGGRLVVVQVGDILDRGDGELAIMDLLDRLSEEARAAGGDVIALLGNHELMNVYGDLSYVTPGGFEAFRGMDELDVESPLVEGVPRTQKPRAAAFVQGGPYARRLAGKSTVVIVNDTLFVHGGILPKHVEYGLDDLNYDVRAWMLWDDLDIPPLMDEDDSPVWYRAFGEATETDCALLDAALQAAGARRMVIGHTPLTDGISVDCDDKLFRIDTGMSSYYGGPVQVLELDGQDAWIVSVAE